MTGLGTSVAQAFITRSIGGGEELASECVPVVSGAATVELGAGDVVVISTSDDASADEPTHRHTLRAVEAIAATCTEEGNRAYWVCDGCGRWFSDASGTDEIADHADVVLAPLGHSWTVSFDWADNGMGGYAGATAHFVCGNDAGHDTDVVAVLTNGITKQPTATVAGERTYTATVPAAVSPDGVEHTATIAVVVPATDKTALELTLAMAGWTYGEDASAPELDGNLGGGTV